MRSCIRRIFKTATAACWFFQPCSACTRFCKNSLLTAATKGRSCKRLWPKRFRISNLKSSNAPIMQKASRFSHDVGSSNVPSHGSTDADDWPRILKTSHATHWHSCVSRQSELCSERFVINNQLLGQTLRHNRAKPLPAPGLEMPALRRRGGVPGLDLFPLHRGESGVANISRWGRIADIPAG